MELRPYELFRGVLFLNLYDPRGAFTAHSIETVWQKLIERLPTENDIEFLKEVPSTHFTKELCRGLFAPLTDRGVPKETFDLLVQNVFRREARSLARRALKVRSPASIVLLKRDVERIGMLVGTGVVTWRQTASTKKALQDKVTQIASLAPRELTSAPVPVP